MRPLLYALVLCAACHHASDNADGGNEQDLAVRVPPFDGGSDSALDLTAPSGDLGPCPVFNTTLPTLSYPSPLPSDWIVVAGKGDGVTDDTKALQNALNQVQNVNYTPKVTVFIPAGKYLITNTLSVPAAGMDGFQLLGTGETTQIIWGGSATAGATHEAGVMFHSSGLAHARYQGIVWDGRGKARVGIDHRSTTLYETDIRHYDERFVNFTYAGVRTDDTGYSDEGKGQPTGEVFFKNDVFQNIKNPSGCASSTSTCGSGIQLYAPNDYDNKILGSAFIDTDIGINSIAGNFNVSSSNFVRSTVDDVQMNAHSFRMQSVVSNCSTQVAYDYQSNNGSELMMTDTHVSHWTSDLGAVSLGNSGPLVLFDSEFTDGPGGAPVQLFHDKIGTTMTAPQQVLSSNNSTDVATLIDKGPAGVVVDVPASNVATSPVGANTWFQSTRPSLPVPTKIYDASKLGVVVDTEYTTDQSAAMQKVIDMACANGDGSMAYFPNGRYGVGKPLVVHGSNCIVSGESVWTWLLWTGDPTQATDASALISVVDPDRVVVMNFEFSESQGTYEKVAAIRQTSAGAASSSVLYEGLNVPGTGLPSGETARAIELVNLPSGATVHVGSLTGAMNVLDSAAASIYVDVWANAVTHVAGSQNPRTGYLDVGARYNAGNPGYDYFIEDNNSITVAHSYSETTNASLHATGTSAEPAGQIVIGMAKNLFYATTPVAIDGYKGLVAFGAGYIATGPTATPDMGFTFEQSGGPSTLFFFGTSFWFPPIFETGSGNTVSSLSSHVSRNGIAPIPLADSDPGSTAVTQTFNALRALRAHELAVDYAIK